MLWIAGLMTLGLIWLLNSAERGCFDIHQPITAGSASSEWNDALAVPTGNAAKVEPGLELKRQMEFLSRQILDLRAQAEDAERAAVRANRALREAQSKLEGALKPLEQEMFSSALRTKVEPGHTVITGGFQVPDGSFEYTMFKPTLATESGKPVILLEGKRMSVHQDQLSMLGLDSLQTNAANTLQHGEVWSPSQVNEFNLKIKELGRGVDVLSNPRVMVFRDQEAQIEIGNYRAIVKAMVPEEGGAIHLELRTEQPRAVDGDQP